MLVCYNFLNDICSVFKVLSELNNILIFLFVLSLAIVVSSLIVVLAIHPIFSLLFLVLNFILAAILLLLLECELLALLFVVIYVGAIAVLRRVLGFFWILQSWMYWSTVIRLILVNSLFNCGESGDFWMIDGVICLLAIGLI